MLSPAVLKTVHGCHNHIKSSNFSHCSGIAQSWGGARELGYFWSYSFIDVLWCALCSIGRGTGYKPSELADMKDGSTLVVGGKEIEVVAGGTCVCAHSKCCGDYIRILCCQWYWPLTLAVMNC